MLRAYVGSFLSLAGLACALTWVYLGMRSVMEIGGACADGGPYVSAQPCPDGVGITMVGGIFGGLICVALFAWFASRLGGGYGTIAMLAWPALFLSLGWNFFDFGISPPGEEEGPVWGWILCGVIFWLMGGLPLLALTKPEVLRTLFWPRDPDPAAASRAPIVPEPLGASLRLPRKADPRHDREFAGITRAQPTRAEPLRPDPDDDVVTQLERLAALRDRGALGPEEYERAKKAVLDG